jgi:hypothetical protein
MNDKYFLMNKDEKLLAFTVEHSALGDKIFETESFSSIRPIGYTDIATWLEGRNYAKHKAHLKKWLKEWQIDSLCGFLDVTHALGINDCLWVKKYGSDLEWGKINLYNNEFSDVAQHTAFESGLYGLQMSSTNLSSVVSPEFTSEGTCPKCWRVEDGHIYLYKAAYSGASNVGKEPYSEYISSFVIRQILGDKCISYDLSRFHDTICSKCSLFTSEKYGYVPFSRLINANKSYTLNNVLGICSDMGYEKECREMIFTDSIIFNQDRHLGNFGFVVDNETFEILDFAPLFDYNISMLCNATDEDLNDFEHYEEEYLLGHKLGGRFSDVGKAVLTSDMMDLIPRQLDFPIHAKYNMDALRTEKIINIMEKNLHKILGRKDYFISQSLSE